MDYPFNQRVIKNVHQLLLLLLVAPLPLAAADWTPSELTGATGAYPHIAVQDNGKAMAVWATYSAVRPAHEHGLVWSRPYVPGWGWGAAEPVYDHARNCDTRAPSVATQPDDGGVAVWPGRSEGGPWVLWASVRRRGESWSPPERVSEEPWQVNGAYAMRVDAQGDVMVLWRGVDAAEKGTLFSTRRVRGRWEPSEVLHEDFGRDDGDTLTFGLGSDGRALASWSKLHLNSGRWTLFISDFDPRLGWSRPESVNAQARDFLFPYAIAFDRRGEALFVWSDGGLWARRLLPGRVWDATHRLGTGMLASACYDDDGNAFVVWQSGRAGTSGIEAARFDRQAGSWEPPRVLESYTSDEQALRPKVHAAGGRVVAAWHHIGNRVLSSATHDPQAGWTRLGDIQAPRPSPFAPSRTPTPHNLAVDSAGNAFLVWMDEPEIWSSRLPRR